jgi:hypothetical protein
MSTAALDLQTGLVAASRERVVAPLSRRERLTHGVTAALFLVAAVALVLVDRPSTAEPWVLAGLLVVSVALATRIELEVGSGFASPVVLVVVPMLFALPPGQVPVAVGLGFVLGQLATGPRGGMAFRRVVVPVGNASYTLAPAILFLLAYEPNAGVGRHAAVAAGALSCRSARSARVASRRPP